MVSALKGHAGLGSVLDGRGRVWTWGRRAVGRLRTFTLMSSVSVKYRRDYPVRGKIAREIIDNGTDSEPDTVYSTVEAHLVAPSIEREATERFVELWSMTQNERMKLVESAASKLDAKLARAAYGYL